MDLCGCHCFLYFADDRVLVVFRYLSSFQTSKVDGRRRNTVGIKDNVMLLAVTHDRTFNYWSWKNVGQLNEESSRERTLYPGSHSSSGLVFLLDFYSKHF
jgi:hypothetical protein